MNHAAALRTHLLAAVLAGTAGCTATATTTPIDPTPTGLDTSGLSAIPDDTLGCGDAPDTAWGGPCCVAAYCYTPGGVSECPATPSDAQMEAWGLAGLGSGTCQCTSLEGPFNNEGTDQTGACCYTMGTQGCEGRPMLVAGIARLAPLVPGSAWAAA